MIRLFRKWRIRWIVQRQVGVPYVWGGSDAPFDCSDLVARCSE